MGSVDLFKFNETSEAFLNFESYIKDRTSFERQKSPLRLFRPEVLEFDMAAKRARLRKRGTALLALIGLTPCMDPLMCDEI